MSYTQEQLQRAIERVLAAGHDYATLQALQTELGPACTSEDDCGCDACDSGSEDLLQAIDETIFLCKESTFAEWEGHVIWLPL